MVLSVRDLTSVFPLDEGDLRAVDRVSFDLAAGETLALVGESGCGKSIVGLSILGLLPPPGRVESGEVWFEGGDLMRAGPAQLRAARGAGIGLVFQEPGAALNPVLRIGDQIADVLRLHRGMNRREAWREAARVLGEMDIPEPERRVRSYPFELSGGMQQRVMIAIAMAARPRVLIADEPTASLDVTVRAEIMDLLAHVRERSGMAMLLISHDIESVAGGSDRILVMYAGRIVETGRTRDVIADPRHPYTQGLLASVPALGVGGDLPPGIAGAAPDPLDLPRGCAFHPRCPLAAPECTTGPPPLEVDAHGRGCACYRASRPA